MSSPTAQLTQQRLDRDADNAYISEGGYLAPPKEPAPEAPPRRRPAAPVATAPVADPRSALAGRSDDAPSDVVGPNPEESDVLRRLGISCTHGTYHHAPPRSDNLGDAIAGALTAVRRNR